MLEVFTPAFVTFFVVVDPIGIAPVFAALTDDVSLRRRRLMALKGTFIAALVLAFFALAGKPFLNALGITLDALRVAGGFMLFVIGYEMVFEKRTKRREESAEHIQGDYQPEDDISVFPIAVPMLAGPGAIAAVMLQMSHNADDPVAQLVVGGALALVLILTLVIFLLAARVTRLMGPTFSQVFSRVLGLVVASFAAQYMLDGLLGTFQG